MSHFHYTDEHFEQQFSSCQLNPELFSHEAHLRLAWIHITKYGVDAALENIQEQLKAYVKHLGAEGKYNKTVTIAAVKAVYHFVLKSKSDNFQDFIIEFPRLKNNFRGLMDSHYGIEIFNSERARKDYIEPDLLPFD
ncbi:MAG: hypothetical protein Salg2KO_12940 [Salibacteraceae bacterium]